MDPQAERIDRMAQCIDLLNSIGQLNAAVNQNIAKLAAALGRKVALNTASLESFERTIADMQAQIDELKEASDGHTQ